MVKGCEPDICIVSRPNATSFQLKPSEKVWPLKSAGFRVLHSLAVSTKLVFQSTVQLILPDLYPAMYGSYLALD